MKNPAAPCRFRGFPLINDPRFNVRWCPKSFCMEQLFRGATNWSKSSGRNPVVFGSKFHGPIAFHHPSTGSRFFYLQFGQTQTRGNGKFCLQYRLHVRSNQLRCPATCLIFLFRWLRVYIPGGFFRCQWGTWMMFALSWSWMFVWYVIPGNRCDSPGWCFSQWCIVPTTNQPFHQRWSNRCVSDCRC